jgi:hypothetical protein
MRVVAQEACHSRGWLTTNTIQAKKNMLSSGGVSTQMFQLFE